MFQEIRVLGERISAEEIDVIEEMKELLKEKGRALK